MLLLSAVCSMLLLSTEQLLLATGSASEELANETYRYVLCCIPGL